MGRRTGPADEKGGNGAFRRVLGADGVPPFAAASIVARLPTGMASLALILFVEREYGSFAAAGITTAAYSIGFGLTAPILGRIVDSRGHRILIPAAAVSALALASIIPLSQIDPPIWTIVIAAGVAGLATPPLSGVVRHRLPELVPRKDVATAYALESIMIELIFVLGPALAGLLSALADPTDALLFAAAAGMFGTIWFSLLLRSEDEEVGRKTARPRGGALSSPAIRLLVLGTIPIGASFGALEVALPAYGSAHGSASLAGAFAAALGVGSICGGLVYGSRPRAFGRPDQAVVRLNLIEAVLFLPLMIDAPVGAMLVLASVSGVAAAPMITARNELVREALPPGTGTEAFSWITVALAVGASTGAALGGALVEAWGWQFGIALAGSASLLCLIIVLSGRDRLRPACDHP